jgi:hypothetical protein
LRKKFSVWTDHLCKAVDASDEEKRVENIRIQEDGGHQNLFLFVERAEIIKHPRPPAGRYAGEDDPHDTVDAKESKRRRAEDRKREKTKGDGFAKSDEKVKRSQRERTPGAVDGSSARANTSAELRTRGS